MSHLPRRPADAGSLRWTPPDDPPGDDVDPAGDGDPGTDGAAALPDEPAAPLVRLRRPLRDRLLPHRAVESWVPETLRDARVDPGRRGALVLTLVAALAAVAAAVGVWRGVPEPRPVQAIPQAVGAPVTATGSSTRAPVTQRDPGSAGPSTGAGPPASSRAPGPAVPVSPAVLAVSVTGAVRRPGLVRVPAGARVADAVAAAGGPSATADLTGLNLAAPLADGDSVVVGSAGTPGAVPGQGPTAPLTGSGARGSVGLTAGGPTAPLDLNTADQAALEELPGVGPVMAGDILAWREQHGRFAEVAQLQEIPGIGPARYARLAPLVTAG